MKLPVTINLDQDLLARVDAAAGPGRRSAWVTSAVERALGGGEPAARSASPTPASSRPPKEYELPKIARRKS